MRLTARRVALALAFCLAAGSAFAQGALRIGLGDDPDGLDPTTSRFYTTRIVFAALCDKLFDIDEKAGIVPQLALGAETSADGKTVTIKLRPGVKFHDGEPFTAEAAKYSLERHMNMKGSFRKPELAAVDSVEVVDPLTVKLNLKQPFSPAARPAHRSRRHDGLAQGGRSGGRQVRAEAGVRRSLQVRRARRAGPHRAREVPRLLEQGPRLHRQDHLPADRRFDRASGQPALGRAGHDGAAAGDRHQDGARRSQAQAQQGGVAGFLRPAGQRRQRRPRPTIRWARIRACARPSTSRSTARR